MSESEAPQIEHEAAHGDDDHVRLRADNTRWSKLAFVGIQPHYGIFDPDIVLELRNCTCGSTLCRRIRRSSP